MRFVELKSKNAVGESVKIGVTCVKDPGGTLPSVLLWHERGAERARIFRHKVVSTLAELFRPDDAFPIYEEELSVEVITTVGE